MTYCLLIPIHYNFISDKNTYICDHWYAEDQHENNHSKGELLSVWLENVRPVVNQTYTNKQKIFNAKLSIHVSNYYIQALNYLSSYQIIYHNYLSSYQTIYTAIKLSIQVLNYLSSFQTIYHNYLSSYPIIYPIIYPAINIMYKTLYCS